VVPAKEKRAETEHIESLNDAVAQLERELILKAMRGSDWVKARAAAMLGISVTNLRYKMKKYRVTEKDRFSLE
jgi:transcriptional regulator with GAF, ATPase, and Fis domain